MIVESAAPHAVRLARLRADLRAVSLDALVVSHLPHVRYLTSFRGTAGVLLVLSERAHFVVDFRYITAARAAIASAGLNAPIPGALAATAHDAIEIVVAETSIDDAVIQCLRGSAAHRIGVEGQWMSVARFN